jgi:3-oxoacyl-[acyl-carrier protein] reductase
MSVDDRSESGRPVAIVTGGANGIGWAISCEAARADWTVAIFDSDADRGVARVAEAKAKGWRISSYPVDVADEAAVRTSVDKVILRHGRIDGLVNNAGITFAGELLDLDFADWRKVAAVNLDGAFHCLRAAGRHMLDKGSGAVVNVASIAAERGAPGRAAYAVSKAGLVSLTKVAAVEWAARGVRVNAVAPGYVDTDLLQSAIEAGRIDPRDILSRIPVRRLASPDEIARVVLFLLGPDSAYMTGQVLTIDGGFLADYGVANQSGIHANATTDRPISDSPHEPRRERLYGP